MLKTFQKLQDWASMKMEDLCCKIPPKSQRFIVFCLFFLFACSSLYLTCDAFYRIGKNEGQKGMMKIEHIDSVPLLKNDSINTKVIGNNLWKQRIV